MEGLISDSGYFCKILDTDEYVPIKAAAIPSTAIMTLRTT